METRKQGSWEYTVVLYEHETIGLNTGINTGPWDKAMEI